MKIFAVLISIALSLQIWGVLSVEDVASASLRGSIGADMSLETYAGTASYSQTLAQHYVYFTAAAYCADPEFFLAGNGKITKWTCKACQKAVPNLPANSNNIRYFQSAVNNLFTGGLLTDINGIVVYDNIRNEIVISFAGTNPTQLTNLIDDINYFVSAPLFRPNNQNVCSGCMVHGGFLSAYNSVRSTVTSLFKTFIQLHPGAKYVITGHSLGAALAALCATDLTVNGYTIQPLYTYGMPRVGNPTFASWYFSNMPGTFRVVNNWDPVPHLGFRNTLGTPFQHFPYEIWYTGFAGFPSGFSAAPVLCNSSGEDPNCSDQYETLIYANLVGELTCHLAYFSVDYIAGFADCAL